MKIIQIQRLPGPVSRPWLVVAIIAFCALTYPPLLAVIFLLPEYGAGRFLAGGCLFFAFIETCLLVFRNLQRLNASRPLLRTFTVMRQAIAPWWLIFVLVPTMIGLAALTSFFVGIGFGDAVVAGEVAAVLAPLAVLRRRADMVPYLHLLVAEIRGEEI